MSAKEDVLNKTKNINSLLKEKTGFSLSDNGNKYFLRLLKKHLYEDICNALKISIDNYFVLGDDETVEAVINNLEGILYTLEVQKDKPEIAEINYLLKIAKNKFNLNGLFYKNLKDLLLDNYNDNDFEKLKEIFCNYSGYTPLKHQLELYYGKE